MVVPGWLSFAKCLDDDIPWKMSPESWGAPPNSLQSAREETELATLGDPPVILTGATEAGGWLP